MKAGLFVTNDFLTFAYQEEVSSLKFIEFEEEDKVFLYFEYDKDQSPPIVIDEEARDLYFPGNEEILGDFLKFLDSENDTYEKSNVSFKSSDILDYVFDRVAEQNPDFFSKKNKYDPFYLIFPAYIGEVAKKKIIHSFQKRFEDGRIADQYFPYVSHLLKNNQIPKSGNILFVEMSYSDFYIYSIQTSIEKEKPKIEILYQESILDTDLLYHFLEAISEEIVQLVVENYSENTALTKEQLENEILFNLPDAQDILIGLSEIGEWSEIEIEAELSDGTGGQVKLKKEHIDKRLIKVIEENGLKSKFDSLIKKFEPSAFVLIGRNFQNYGIRRLLREYETKVSIIHEDNYHENIFKEVFDQDVVCKSLNVGELAEGQLVTLYNFNNDIKKGSKGPSEHDLQYLGNMEFRVVRSTRSLQVGMTLKCLDKFWKKDMQLGFNVLKADGFNVSQLNGKSLKFIMRPNQGIALRKWLN